MTTKEKIIQTALKVFNEQGLEATSIRKIAETMGITHGNLRYHYKTKADIVYQIFLDLQAAIDQEFENIFEEGISIAAILKTNEQSAAKFMEYRFFMYDFIAISRLYPRVKKGLQDNFKARKQQINAVFQYFIATGILKPEPFKGIYEMIMEGLFIVNDFWMPSFEIYSEESMEENIMYYCNLWVIHFYPYLTETG